MATSEPYAAPLFSLFYPILKRQSRAIVPLWYPRARESSIRVNRV
jgi:hypothetical protein